MKSNSEIFISYQLCDCGAISLGTESGETYSVSQARFAEFSPQVDLEKCDALQQTYACNHCCNRYGVDLCGCGSGEPFGTCDGGHGECNRPMQVVGEYTKVVAKGAW